MRPASAANREKVLKALESRAGICDPACGSGAYLLGMMQELVALARELCLWRTKVDPLDQYDRKLEIIERNLVWRRLDWVSPSNIAMLRLWLSLIVDYNGDARKICPPCPTCNTKSGEGDSLTAPNPNDLRICLSGRLSGVGAASWPRLQREWFEESYRRSKGESTRTKTANQSRYRRQKRGESQTTLGDVAPPDSHDWRLQALPKFLPTSGFDIILANPPYGASVADATRDLYFARGQGRIAIQRYLRPLHGARSPTAANPAVGSPSSSPTPGAPSKATSRCAGCLLTEIASVSHVLDLPAWIFGATVNTGILTFQKAAPGADEHGLIAADLRGLGKRAIGTVWAMQLRAVALRWATTAKRCTSRAILTRNRSSALTTTPRFSSPPPRFMR